jgi:hypothetical protein
MVSTSSLPSLPFSIASSFRSFVQPRLTPMLWRRSIPGVSASFTIRTERLFSDTSWPMNGWPSEVEREPRVGVPQERADRVARELPVGPEDEDVRHRRREPTCGTAVVKGVDRGWPVKENFTSRCREVARLWSTWNGRVRGEDPEGVVDSATPLVHVRELQPTTYSDVSEARREITAALRLPLDAEQALVGDA